MDLEYFIIIHIYIASEEDYGSVRGGGSLQNIAALHDRYPIYVLGPYHSDERQRPNLNALRGLNMIYDLPYTYPKRFVDKKSLDSIGGGHLI